MTRSPRDTAATWLVVAVVGALLLSACASPGSDMDEGSQAPSGASAASAASTSMSPHRGRTILEEDESPPATQVPTAAVVVDDTTTELVLGASCWDGLCVDGLPVDQRDDVLRLTSVGASPELRWPAGSGADPG